MNEKLDTTSIPLARLRPSPTQPRKHFDEDAHNELTQSMKTRGFTLSALLVRPWPGQQQKNGETIYEIVTGERRFRAAQAAEISAAPCFIQELSDGDVLEIQLIENIQRSDLTPIEEAEGYRKILSLRGENKKPVYTYESLALRIGKSARQIRDRVRLCELDQEARRELDSGRLPLAVALLIARIPDTEQRSKATQMVLHPVREVGPLSYRRTEELIHREFIRDLRAASFDQEDPELYTIQLEEGTDRRVAGGACTDCPFRPGTARPTTDSEREARTQESGGYTRSYICLQPSCYDTKEKLSWKNWQDSQTVPEFKRRATTLEQSLKLYPKDNTLAPGFNLVDLAQYPDGSDLRAGQTAPGNWKELTKGAQLEVIVTKDRLGKVHELVDRLAAIEAARTINKHKIFKGDDTDQRRTDEASFRRSPTEFFERRRTEEKTKSAGREEEKAVLIDCVSQVGKKFSNKVVPELLRLVVAREIYHSNAHPDFFKRYRLPVTKDVYKQLVKRKPAELAAMLVEFVVCDGGFNYEFEPALSDWFEIFGVDYKKTKKRVTAAISKKTKTKGKK